MGEFPAPIALFGGSFDPVHNGHLRMAIEASALLRAEVRLVPSGTPPHRNVAFASAEDRAAMLGLALRDLESSVAPPVAKLPIALDRREIERSGPSFSIDTLRDVRGEIGPARALVLLIGADQFAVLDTWRDWQDLFELAHIGVLTRGHALPEVSAGVNEFVASRWLQAPWPAITGAAGQVMRLSTTALDISSSRIRADLAGGRSPRWLLPDVVLDYINAHQLYAKPPA